MPVSSLGSAMTAAPYFFTSGRISSIRSSSAVTELTSALPSYAASPASSASTTEESMHSGRSVSSWMSLTARESRSASSVSGTPMLTSSTCAPPATCCRDVELDLRQVARAQLLLELLAPGRVDPLADDAERLVGPDRDRLRRRTQNRVHALSSSGSARRCRRSASPRSVTSRATLSSCRKSVMWMPAHARLGQRVPRLLEHDLVGLLGRVRGGLDPRDRRPAGRRCRARGRA